MNKWRIYSYLVFLVFTFYACEKNIEVFAPVAVAEVFPPHGNTNTEFLFNASQTQIRGDDTILFYRWDLDGDNKWDTPYSKSPKLNHRYKKAGEYYPRLEVQNYSGLSDSLDFNKIDVKYSHSPPHAAFIIFPLTGNIATDFTFDANRSYDDEDSITNLLYRWDWEGDEIWDTEQLSDPVTKHRYTEANIYNPILEVTDSRGLSSVIADEVSVDMHNPGLMIDFKILPDSGTTDYEFIFDGRECKDIENPNNKLLYRWKLVGQKDTLRYLIIDTDFQEEPLFKYEFLEFEFGLKTMYLIVMDENGLVNSAKKEFVVHYSNLSPTADFKAIPKRGNVYTNYYFRSVNFASDPDEFSHELHIRWDFENDGIWETDIPRDNREIFHKYSSPGIYEIACEVTDSKGLSDICVHKVYVSTGINETGYIEHRIPPYDKLKWKYYGTVKIGDQWWTSENMNFPELEEYPYLSTCYDNLESNCREYGGLYLLEDLFDIDEDDDRQPIPACPKGWHIPSLDDWNILFDNYGGMSQAYQELTPGGSSDFNVLMAGEKLSWDITNPNRELYLGKDSYSILWTSKLVFGHPLGRAVVFKSRNGSITKFVYTIYTDRFSLRCIKD